jgi:hypothetical protein
MSIEKKLSVDVALFNNSDFARSTGIIRATIRDGIHFADLQDYNGGTIHIRLDEHGNVKKAVIEYGE